MGVIQEELRSIMEDLICTSVHTLVQLENKIKKIL